MILYAQKHDDPGGQGDISLYACRPNKRREKGADEKFKTFLFMKEVPIFVIYPAHGAFYIKFENLAKKPGSFYQIKVTGAEVQKIVTHKTKRIITKD